MKNFLNELRNKYSYNKELIEFIEKIVPILIRYYGEDKKGIIINSLLNCEIHIQGAKENTNEYLNSFFHINKNWDMRHVIAFYNKYFYIINGKLQNKSIIYIRTDSSGNVCFYDYNFLQTLIHEICHAIKSYGTEKYDDNIIIDRSGLSITYYQNNNGSIEEYDNILVGIEEAFNECDATIITSMLVGEELQPSSYKGATSYAMEIRKRFEKLYESIQKSQFSGSDDWIKIIGENKAKKLIDCFDIVALIPERSVMWIKEKRDDYFKKKNNAYNYLEEFIDKFPTKNIEDTISEKFEEKSTFSNEDFVFSDLSKTEEEFVKNTQTNVKKSNRTSKKFK